MELLLELALNVLADIGEDYLHLDASLFLLEQTVMVTAKPLDSAQVAGGVTP